MITSVLTNDWRSLYLRQAQSDYAVLRLLLDTPNVPLCQKLHYLQMTTEKLAKGLMTEPGAPSYKRTHNAFVDFMRVIRTRKGVQKVCGFTNVRAFASFIDSLLPLAQEIEDLSPDGISHPNPEYPWDDENGPISPLDYPFASLRFTANPKMSRMILFVEACLTLN